MSQKQIARKVTLHVARIPRQSKYRITEKGRKRIWNGDPRALESAKKFSVWMVLWVAWNIPECTLEDFKQHARNVRTYPQQPEATLQAARYLDSFTDYVVMRAIEVNWIEKVA
jgi:hypothetical protein